MTRSPNPHVTLAGLAALLLSGSIALAQQPTPQDAPPSAATPAPAPRPPMRPGGPMPSHGFKGSRDGFHGSGFDGGMSGLRIGPPGMWWKNPNIVQKLALTADQTKKMDDIFQQSRLQLIDLRATLEKQNALLDPLLSANPPDTTKALAQIDKVAQARADLEKASARMLLSIRGVLTPDQWTKLNTRDTRDGGDGRQNGQPGGDGGRSRSYRGGPGGQNIVAPRPEL